MSYIGCICEHIYILPQRKKDFEYKVKKKNYYKSLISSYLKNNNTYLYNDEDDYDDIEVVDNDDVNEDD